MENQSVPPTSQTSVSQPQSNLSEFLPIVPKKKKNIFLIIILFCFFLTATGVAGYFGYKNYQLKKQTPQVQPSLLPIATTSPALLSPSPVQILSPTPTANQLDNKTFNVGGPCSYDEFAGKCLITAIQNNTAILFKFTPDKPLNLKNGWVTEDLMTKKDQSKAIAYLGLNCLKDEKGNAKYPITEEDIEKCGLKENAVFNCEVKIIKSGTCTPINFTFFD